MVAKIAITTINIKKIGIIFVDNDNFQQPNLITVKEAANYLRIPVPTVYYLVQRGQLPAVQIGGRWRIKKDEIDTQILGKSASDSSSSANQAKTDAPVATPQILIIDDEVMIHQLIKDVLIEDNCNIDSALNGQEAMSKISAKKYDLVFLDMVLPEMSGDQIYEYISKTQPNLMVVIITAFVDNKVLDRVLSTGPITILPKPIDIHQLRQLTKVLVHLHPAPKS